MLSSLGTIRTEIEDQIIHDFFFKKEMRFNPEAMTQLPWRSEAINKCIWLGEQIQEMQERYQVKIVPINISRNGIYCLDQINFHFNFAAGMYITEAEKYGMRISFSNLQELAAKTEKALSQINEKRQKRILAKQLETESNGNGW